MKKGLIIVAAVLVLIIGGTIVATLQRTTSTTTPTGTQSPAGEAKIVSACKVLTPEVASAYLGQKVSSDQAPDTTGDDIVVSSCTYTTAYVAGQPDSIKSVNLLARSAKSSAGADTNASVFGAQRPGDAETVEGLGDDAFWSPSTGQLNVYKNSNWYIITAGNALYNKRTVDEAKQLTDKIIENL